MIAYWLNSACWTQTDHVRESNGGVFRNLTTVDECKSACANNYTCVAVEWNPNNAREACWIQLSTDTEDLVPAQTEIGTRYELKRACLLSWSYFYFTQCSLLPGI